jgi:hypothetical protein
MHRIIECRASRDYRLWLRFGDGLQGSVFLGDLLEVCAFGAWRDADEFCRALIDRTEATVVWPAGIRLDPDILHQDLVASRGMDSSGRGVPRRLNSPRREGRDVVPLNPMMEA